ncbi:toll-like receptor 2 [Pecten maximus]|uniref:toll-like receptor 2 n=1 Tax=Pecten maximus TaxID=6579 RepID=UPI001458A7E7|nr:toll-like receptor 2 [Pecten maximus]
MSHVTCSGCQLEVVPQNLPTNTVMLNLRNNHLRALYRRYFLKLPTLKTLILSMNALSVISPGTFDDLVNLEYLDISENHLTEFSIESAFFLNLKNLKVLNLQMNDFHFGKTYPENALSCIPQLESLVLDIFEGFHFGNGFLNLTKLTYLKFHFIGNERISFLNSSFLGLQRSNISHLHIDFPIRKLEINFLSPLSKLKTLTLNSESKMTIHDVLRSLYGLRGRTMESLQLSSNYVKHTGIVHLIKSDILHLGTICVRKLELAENGIGTISQEAVLSWTRRDCIEILDLSRNQSYNAQFLFLINLFPSITYLYVSYMGSEPLRKRNIQFEEHRIFFVPISLIYINASHYPIINGVSNITFANNSIQILDISFPTKHPSCSSGFVEGLVHMKELDLSGWDCSNPRIEMFSEMQNLLRLEASHCKLKSTLESNKPSLFKGLFNLSFIDISSNNLNRLNINIFKDQVESLKSLILAWNQMERLPTEVLQRLSVLETLDISNNLITTLRSSELDILDSLRLKSNKFRIDLFGNPLVCSCDTLDFLSWISTTENVYNKGMLKCIMSGGTQIKMEEFLTTFEEFQDSCVSRLWLIISVVLSITLFVCGVFAREAWRRRVWLRVKCRQPLEHNQFQYDIFICFCDEDSGWTANTFIPWLNETEFEYCFDDKSFKPGRDIADNIMDSIDSSRQTVFVVSCTFLEREWTMFTMKLASVYSFREGRENMNIIILLNDIKKSEFPKLIRINWDLIRPLRWPNENNTDREKPKELFWKKLSRRIKQENTSSSSADVCETAM